MTTWGALVTDDSASNASVNGVGPALAGLALGEPGDTEGVSVVGTEAGEVGCADAGVGSDTGWGGTPTSRLALCGLGYLVISASFAYEFLTVGIFVGWVF